MTVQFEDIRCTAFSGFCDNAVCELLEDAIVATVVSLRKVAFGGILPEAQVKSFLRKRLRCKRNITETLTVGKYSKTFPNKISIIFINVSSSGWR